ISLSELGFIAEQRGDPAAARSLHLESLTAARTIGDRQAVAQALTGLAGAQALGGQPDQAAQLLGAADAARRSAGASLPPRHTAPLRPLPGRDTASPGRGRVHRRVPKRPPAET